MISCKKAALARNSDPGPFVDIVEGHLGKELYSTNFKCRIELAGKDPG